MVEILRSHPISRLIMIVIITCSTLVFTNKDFTIYNFFHGFFGIFWSILISIENFYFIEMNKRKKNNSGKQFVDSGFVKTCDEHVINPHFI